MIYYFQSTIFKVDNWKFISELTVVYLRRINEKKHCAIVLMLVYCTFCTYRLKAERG